MPIGNLQSASGQLKDATKKLVLAWDTVRESWADQRAAEFEEDVIQALLEEVTKVMPAIDQMSATLQASKRALDE